MERYGMLINYEFCTGCHSCEVSCQMENQLPPNQFGIKISPIGPWEYAEDTWQYSYIPCPTDQCSLCMERIAEGKTPSCMLHCQAKVLKIGKVEDLKKDLDSKPMQVLFVPKQ